MKDSYDLIILGGGLAGLTLALQIKQANQNIDVLVLERRNSDAPDAAHKVGESTVELGTHYLREVLNLKDYLDKEQLPKHGLRFFFSPEHKNNIEKRVELGPRKLLPVPSHQIDRGTFENKLVELNRGAGNTVLLNSTAKEIKIGEKEERHTITAILDEKEVVLKSKWVVDSTGRSSFLKRKLGFKKELDHAVSAAWFRVKGEIDVDNWSSDMGWSNFLEPGLRRLSTIHLMDKGYWVWFIPLGTGNTSVGIVADPEHHPFNTYNTLEKAYDWLEANEPQAFNQLLNYKEGVLDFKVLKHFAHHSERLFDIDRWAVTGESGLFLDPFYSPGTDFISLSNTLVADLILDDFNGVDIHLKTNVYERTLFALFDNWVPIYQNKYSLWGKTQTMVLKIFWDWATYWGIPTLLFTNHGYTNLMVLRDLFATEGGVGQRFGQLNQQMQKVFLEWAEHDVETFENKYIDPFDIGFLRTFHREIDERFNTKGLIEKVHSNLSLLEEIAVQLFCFMSNKIYGTPIDMSVDPYTMSLKTKPTPQNNGVIPSQKTREEVNVMWFYELS